MARWYSCNVLQTGADARRLWQFDARNGGFALHRTQTAAPGDSLPGNLINKTWRSLWQPKLNVAWLRPDSVFLRVVHLPQSNLEETLSMVELQLEKLSPIPVTQVVWSVHPLSQTVGSLQTVIVIFAERKGVEEFLGELEGEGFLADRLELPVLDQLQATVVNKDGAWIYPGASGAERSALVAWWYGGALQSLNFLTLAATEDGADNLREQVAHTIWAGEMEGWLTSPPTWHLVADGEAAAEWEPALRQGLEEPVTLIAPMAEGELAALTAKRAANAPAKANLLPPEYGTRYRQQFVDRLWMRGLAAVGVVYAIAIGIYFIALGVQMFRVNRVETQVKNQSQTYTNAMQLKARYDVLKERQDLKFAALDSWKTVAELMPESLGLESLNFFDGRKLTLIGTAPADQATEILDFVKAMRKATANGQPLFDQSKDDHYRSTVGPGGTTRNWSFDLELKRTERR